MEGGVKFSHYDTSLLAYLFPLQSYYLPPYNYEVLERQKQKLKSARDLARDTSEAQEAADLMDYLSPMLNLYYENQVMLGGIVVTKAEPR